MLNKFKVHLESEFPELLEHPFLIACSGGVDSVALTHLCANLKLDFALAHCNFGLRGEEGDQDERFVRSLAKKLNKKIFITDFETEKYSTLNKVSIQVAARQLRYTWFGKLLEAHSFKKLVTAHHSDDNLETFLINLSRGTGIAGLTGIPANTVTISRPLLPFSKETLRIFMEENGHAWREDLSNAEDYYFRNKIRHHVVPILEELQPNFKSNFQHSQELLRESGVLLGQYAERLRSELFKGDGDIVYIAVVDLKALRPLKGYLHLLFKPYGFSALDDLSRLLFGLSGKEVRSKTHRLVRDREYLLLQAIPATTAAKCYEIAENDEAIAIPMPLKIKTVSGIGATGPSVLYVDKKTLKYPLTVRKWQHGDYFYPLGMKGKKKLSKYFKDEKVSVIDKQRQWLLCSDNAIVWVMGRRADDRFKVTDTTKEIVKFELNK